MSNIASNQQGKPLAVTPGDPAGIGPDLCISLACQPPGTAFVAVADPAMLAQRAAILGRQIKIREVDSSAPFRCSSQKGVLDVVPVALHRDVTPGTPDPESGAYIIETLQRAVALCRDGSCGGLVTGPVSKSVVAGTLPDFSGHTEWLGRETGAPLPVMMLACDRMRVALVTTHLPLKAVPGAITRELIVETGTIVYRALQQQFGIAAPRILVAGLNPHAGEDGLLGTEEQEIIAPALATLAEQGMPMTGPLPADSMFTTENVDRADAFIAMYHDQGLSVIKHAGFGEVVNITLGLPIVRTSVDHGTAYDLAGTGKASENSLRTALRWAASLADGNPIAGT